MAESKMELEDWLDDLCVRFIINLPAEDLSSVARICFQVEEAQWFYEDFIRPLDPTLPSMTLRGFCLKIFQHCPLLASFPVENHMRAFEEFLQYKTRVPVRGAIMLNEAMDSTVLVKGWKKGANWSFPRGKINKDEDDLDCAIREVYEETGFDIRAAGLVPRDDQVKFIEINMREQQLRLYVFRNVPMDTHFEPKTRKEISRIEWYKLSELPAFRKKGASHRDDAAAANNANKFYMVAPFLVPLKKWVVQQKKRDGARVLPSGPSLATQPIYEEGFTEDDAAPRPAAAAAATAPAIETFEGATRELQRLLNVQPSTQDAPPETSSAGTTAAADPGQAKGNALLALLQSGSRSSAGPVIDTHARPLNASSAAAHFPSSGPTLGAGQTAHATAHHSQPPSYQRVPSAGFQSGSRFAGSPSMATHPSAVPGGAPMLGGSQGPTMPPLMSHLPGPYEQREMSLNANTSPLYHQLRDPAVPAPRAASLGPFGSVPYTNQGQAQAGFRPNQSPVPADPHHSDNWPPLPHLNSHAMSLLNAFTANSARGPDSGLANPPVPEQAHGATSLPGTVPGGKSGVSGTGAGPASLQESSQGQVLGDRHRNALLDVFKSQVQIPSSRDPPSVGGAHGADPSLTSRAGAGSTPGAHGMAVEANHDHAQADPDLNLPFGALKLLSRSGGLQRGDSPAPVPAPNSFSTMPTAIAHSSFGPQGGTGLANVTGSPAYPSMGPSPGPLPHGSAPDRPSSVSHVPAPHTVSAPAPRRLETNAGQKNLLLSLFARSQTPSQATSGIEGGGKGKEAAESLPPPGISPYARDIPRPGSGMTRFALPSGERPISRSGTQTPMSSADRSFLLGYLQSVTTHGSSQQAKMPGGVV